MDPSQESFKSYVNIDQAPFRVQQTCMHHQQEHMHTGFSHGSSPLRKRCTNFADTIFQGSFMRLFTTVRTPGGQADQIQTSPDGRFPIPHSENVDWVNHKHSQRHWKKKHQAGFKWIKILDSKCESLWIIVTRAGVPIVCTSMSWGIAKHLTGCRRQHTDQEQNHNMMLQQMGERLRRLNSSVQF